MRPKANYVVFGAGAGLAAVAILRITGFLDRPLPILIVASVVLGIILGGLMRLIDPRRRKAKENLLARSEVYDLHRARIGM